MKIENGTFGSCKVLFFITEDGAGSGNDLINCPFVPYTHHKGLGYFAHKGGENGWSARGDSLAGLKKAVRVCLGIVAAGGKVNTIIG